MIKTAKQWLLSLKDHHRDLALKKLRKSRERWECDSLLQAVSYVSWGEEDSWWQALSDLIENDEYFDYPQLTPQKITVKVKEFTAPELVTTNSEMPSKEWFIYLKPEHREAALDLDYDHNEDDLTQYTSLKDALLGRKWNSAEPRFWEVIYNQLSDNTYHTFTPLPIERMATEENLKELDKLIEGVRENAAPPTEPNFSEDSMFFESDYDNSINDKPPESICQEAQRIQGGDRQQDYGSPAKNFQDIADLWSAYIKTTCGVDVDLKARDVAHMSILMKISRNVHKPKRDNWVDMAGYAQCGGKVDEL